MKTGINNYTPESQVGVKLYRKFSNGNLNYQILCKSPGKIFQGCAFKRLREVVVAAFDPSYASGLSVTQPLFCSPAKKKYVWQPQSMEKSRESSEKFFEDGRKIPEAPGKMSLISLAIS